MKLNQYEINRQFTEQGVLIQSGGLSIVDASVIEAEQCRPNRGKNGQSSQDPQAAWSVKTGSEGKRQSMYGYKAHINVDEDGLIKETEYTAGNVHDSNCFTDLLDGDEAAVYADSAYCSDAHHAWLKQTNIANRITKRAYRNRPLYMGLDRNRTGFELMCVAHNIKRALSIRQESFEHKCQKRKMNLKYKITLNQGRCEMKFYDELKAEIEAIQQQMVEAKKNERANALKEVKHLFKEFGFTAGMLKGSLAGGRKKK